MINGLTPAGKRHRTATIAEASRFAPMLPVIDATALTLVAPNPEIGQA